MKKKAEQTQPFLNPQITGLETFPRLLHLGRSIASTNGHGDDSECTANVLALAEENLLGTDSYASLFLPCCWLRADRDWLSSVFYVV